MTLYMQNWPIETAINAGFEKEFPELAAKLRKCGIGVYKQKPKRGYKGDMLGFPIWRTTLFDDQISGFLQDKPDLPYTRETLIARVEKNVSRRIKGQRSYKKMTREQRIEAAAKALEDAWTWACRNGYSYNSFITGWTAGGDHATRLQESVGVWLWGIGQVCAVSIDRKDERTISEILLEAYHKKAMA